jgi:hypothetical protein
VSDDQSDRIADALRARQSLENEAGGGDLLAEALGAGVLPGDGPEAADKSDADDGATDEGEA